MNPTDQPPPMRVSRGGVAAEHGTSDSVGAKKAARTRTLSNIPALRPIACWRLENLRFEFDSSFIRPDAALELTAFAVLWKKHGQPPLSIFGHADPVGDDQYNKALSGRRAMAVYGLLTRDAKMWEELNSFPFATDKWGLKYVQTMLLAAGFDPGTPDGISGPKTTAAIKSFQAARGLLADGVVGAKTRAQLFLAYMDAICRDESAAPFSLSRTDFLAGGQDPGGKGDYQGCSEFNPIMLFSKAENQELSKPGRKAERDAANAANRRVLIFLFPPGSSISPQAWPCPRAKEGPAGCKLFFFPDGEARRSFQDKHREYAKDKDTFACSFYDSLAQLSPCESVRQTLRFRLFDPDKNPIPNAPYRLSILDTGEERLGDAAEDGTAIELDVLAPSTCVLRWGDPALKQTPLQLGYQATLSLDVDLDDQDDESYRRRLRNLGYPDAQFLADSVRAFQRDYGLTQTGRLDEETKSAITDAANFGLSPAEIAAKN